MVQPGQLLFDVTAAGDTDIGRREHNEDAVLVRPDLDLFVVADGAGGHAGGHVASAIATAALAHRFEETQHEAAMAPDVDELGLSPHARRLSSAVHKANREVLEIAKTSDRHRGMGTTVVAAHFRRDTRTLFLAHVGDSRCYRLRDGHMELLTHDHTLINDVLELRPDLSIDHAKQLPPYVITRALGMSDSLRVSVRELEVSSRDRYLLCSDGVTDVLDADSLASALMVEESPEEIVRVIIELAKSEGAKDNLAALAITCGTFAPSISARPPRPSTRPKRTTWGLERSDPEIVVIGLDRENESAPPVHVVPAEAANHDWIDAVNEFVDPWRYRKRDDDGRESTQIMCTRCGKPFVGEQLVCTLCGFPRTE